MQHKKNKVHFAIKLLLLLNLVLYNLPKLHAQDDRVYFQKKMMDYGLYIELWHSKALLFGTVSASVSVKNTTPDVLRVWIEYGATSLGGNHQKWLIGPGGSTGTIIKPGATLKGFENSCTYDFELHNDKSIFKNDKSVDPVHEMEVNIIKVENVTKMEQEAKDKKEKEATDRKEKQEKAKLANTTSQNNTPKSSQEDIDFWSGTSTKKQTSTNSQGNSQTNVSKDPNVNNKQALPIASGSYIVNHVVRSNSSPTEKKTNSTNQNTAPKQSKEDNDFWNGSTPKKQTQQNSYSGSNNTNANSNNGTKPNSFSTDQQKRTVSNNLIDEGNILAKQGDFEGAKAKYNQSLNIDPNNSTASSNIRIANQNIANKSQVENHNNNLLNSALLEQAATQAKMEAVGKFAGIANTVIGNMMEDRAKRKQEEEAQKQAQLASEERAEKKRQLVKLRKDFITGYSAKMPLSAQTHNISEVYFFMFKCDETTLEANYPTIYLSNIFSVDKYADDTWPFMNAVMEKIGKTTKESKYKLAGYFSTRADADKKLQLFIDNCVEYGFTINDVMFNYNNNSPKSSQINSAKTDFWGSSVKDSSDVKSPETNTKPKTDFWGNPIKE